MTELQTDSKDPIEDKSLTESIIDLYLAIKIRSCDEVILSEAFINACVVGLNERPVITK